MSKRKSIWILSTALLVVIFMSTYYFLDRQIVREESLGMFNHAMYDNAKQLHDDVELVVLATVTSESKEIITEGTYLDGYTLTNIKVIKEIKNSRNISTQDLLTIIEPTFSIENKFPAMGRTQFYSADYRKSVPGANYFFFLNWDEKKQAYWVHALHQGKINVDQKDLKEEEVLNHNKSFKKLKEDVIKNYTIH